MVSSEVGGRFWENPKFSVFFKKYHFIFLTKSAKNIQGINRPNVNQANQSTLGDPYCFLGYCGGGSALFAFAG